MPKKVLVTGAAGFIGANVVRELLAEGDDVKCFVRATSDTQNLTDIMGDVEVIFGDIRDDRSLRRALDECDRIYHIAALYSYDRTHTMDSFVQNNVEGTRTVCRVCMEAGIERMVYTSSTVAVGLAASDALADEETVWNLHIHGVPYMTSKYLAEVEVIKAAAKGFDAVVVNPSAPVGKYDFKPTPTGGVILDLLRGKIPLTPEIGIPFVHVGDVARGHRLAMEHGERGERYIFHKETVALPELASRLQRIAGVKKPKFSVNRDIANWVMALRFLLPGVCFPAMLRGTAVLGRLDYDNRKSMSRLGLTYRSVDEGISEAVDYYYARGMATRPSTAATSPAPAPPVPAVSPAAPPAPPAAPSPAAPPAAPSSAAPLVESEVVASSPASSSSAEAASTTGVESSASVAESFPRNDSAI